MKNWIFAISFCLSQLMSAGLAFAHNENEHQITMVMMKQFDKPEAPLTVLPISVEGDYAVAGWNREAAVAAPFCKRTIANGSSLCVGAQG